MPKLITTSPFATYVCRRPQPENRLRGLSPSRVVLALTMLGAGAAVQAADLSVGFVLAGSNGKGRCVDAFACDRSSGGGKVFGSWRFDDALDVQVVGFDAGHFKGGDTTPLGTAFGGRFMASGGGVTLGYRWAFAQQWSLTGRAGVAAVRTRFDYVADELGHASKTTAQPLAGLRLAWQATPQIGLGLDYDVTRFKVHTTRGTLQMFGVAAQFTF